MIGTFIELLIALYKPDSRMADELFTEIAFALNAQHNEVKALIVSSILSKATSLLVPTFR